MYGEVAFQYFSDVHSEHMNERRLRTFLARIKPCAPYLCLAGDIGNPYSSMYASLLRHVSRMFRRVFVVAGNHEYFRKKKKHACRDKRDEGMKETDEQIRTVCAEFDNVVFLQNDTYACDEFVIFGSTMWTTIEEEERESAAQRVSDFMRIPNFDIERRHRLHQDALASLRQALDEHTGPRPFVVVTHHVPLKRLTPHRYSDCGYNSAYACDVPVQYDRVSAWIFGHSHTDTDDGIFRSQTVGYPGEKPYNVNATFSVKMLDAKKPTT